jgi:hypothetical protein
MKTFVALTLLTFAFTLGVICQKPSKPRSLPAVKTTLTPIRVDKMGFLEIALPPGMKESEVTDTPADMSSALPSDYFDKTWIMGAGKTQKRVDIMVHSSHADFATALGRPGSTITPEMLLALQLFQDQRSISDKRVSANEAAAMTISEVPGSMVSKRDPSNGRLTVIWGTYRYFNNCAQEIMISVEGMTKQDALTVIRSIKLGPSDKK